MTVQSYEPLSSSHIVAVTHDDQTQQLGVTFTDGSTYSYGGVPMSVFQGFRESRSAGEFFQRYVKDRYLGARV